MLKSELTAYKVLAMVQNIPLKKDFQTEDTFGHDMHRCTDEEVREARRPEAPVRSPESKVGTVAMTVLKIRAGSSSDPEAVLTATSRAYDDLAGVLVPLIGEVGLKALSSRALHLAQREYPADLAVDTATADGTSEALEAWLKQVEQSLAMKAASAMFSAMVGLLGTFIGESLAMRLLRKAWPDGFADQKPEETHP